MIRAPSVHTSEVDEDFGIDLDRGFGIRYEVIAPVERPPDEDATASGRRDQEDGDAFWVSGRDDLGTEYEVTGGASGRSENGDRDEGVLDVYPTPPEATWLDLEFHSIWDGGESPGPFFVLGIPLPLPMLTYAEIAEEKGMSEADLRAMVAFVRELQRQLDEADGQEAE